MEATIEKILIAIIGENRSLLEIQSKILKIYVVYEPEPCSRRIGIAINQRVISRK